MILFICHPITLLLSMFFLIMNDSFRNALIERKAIRNMRLKNDLKSCLSVVDNYKNDMTDIMYIDLCNSLLSAYENIEN